MCHINPIKFRRCVATSCHLRRQVIPHQPPYPPQTPSTGVPWPKNLGIKIGHRIHGAAIYGNMDPINIPPMLAYIPYMDPMGRVLFFL